MNGPYQLVHRVGVHEALLAAGSKEHCSDIRTECRRFPDLYQGKLILRNVGGRA